MLIEFERFKWIGDELLFLEIKLGKLLIKDLAWFGLGIEWIKERLDFEFTKSFEGLLGVLRSLELACEEECEFRAERIKGVIGE